MFMMRKVVVALALLAAIDGARLEEWCMAQGNGSQGGKQVFIFL